MHRLILALFVGLTLISAAFAAEKLAISVDTATASIDDFYGQPVVNVRWSEEGRRTFADFTRQHVGQRVDLLVGEEVVTSPVVQAPLEGAQIQITGLATLSEAEDIARRITDKKARIFVRLAEDAD